MSAPSASRSRGLARLAGLFSLRTISGKLIIGLLVLFGLASVIVSVITAQSLNNSLMSSLNQQLQAAANTWTNCVVQSTLASQHHDSDPSDASKPDPDDYAMCSDSGQAPGTFVELLTGRSIAYKHTVKGTCPLSAADEATLVKLPPGGHVAPARPADSGGSNPPRPAPPAAVQDVHRDAGLPRRRVPAHQGDRSPAGHRARHRAAPGHGRQHP